MLNTLMEYGEDVADKKALLLHGIGKSFSVRGSGHIASYCLRSMKKDARFIDPCLKVAGYLAKGPTIMDQTISAAIIGSVKRRNELDPGETEIVELYENLSKLWIEHWNDSGFESTFESNLIRYIEVDAYRETLVQFGALENDGKKREALVSLDLLEDFLSSQY